MESEGREDLTAERFRPDPYHVGQRMYATGDRVRRTPDGLYHFLGRTDNQVKVRGFRIELGEVEAVMASHPAVRESAVVAIPHERWGERPAALIVLAHQETATADEIKEFLSTKVASWQVPDVVVFVDDLPKTGVGKIDKRRLRDEVVPRLIAQS